MWFNQRIGYIPQSVKVGTPKETAPDERRVALVPDTVSRLGAASLEVTVESGAGSAAYIPDDAYEKAGASVVKGAAALLADADAVLKVQAPSAAEVELIKKDAVLISFLQPATQGDIVRALAKRGVTAFSQIGPMTQGVKNPMGYMTSLPSGESSVSWS